MKHIICTRIITLDNRANLIVILHLAFLKQLLCSLKLLFCFGTVFLKVESSLAVSHSLAQLVRRNRHGTASEPPPNLRAPAEPPRETRGFASSVACSRVRNAILRKVKANLS